MTPELIVFIAAILFGILVCWRESKGNKLYRFVNKILNSKELQMKASNKKGFVFQQTFLLRLVFIAAFYLMSVIVIQFLNPKNNTQKLNRIIKMYFLINNNAGW